jgi:hypothetical protein
MRKREAGRKIWLVDPDYVRKTERYVRNLVERENRYAWRKYKDEAAIAVFEIMNEPGYVDYAEMGTEEAYAPLRQGFEMWRASKGLSDNLNLYYPLYRYEYVKEYVDRMCAAIRGAGAQKPIAWNLNWPHMIGGHEDVFQAVADSTVDVVSFCLYPGQEDVPSPFWNHPTDLSGKNYLPFLRRHYDEYRRLRWLLGKRFAGKAKAVYEFETFYNQTSYLYPAMARLFRSLGAQIAHMWTYSLTPTAEYLGGSHHLNLYCTPQKAVSFIIAEAVFAESPRYAPYDATGTDPVTFDHCAVSFAGGASSRRPTGSCIRVRSIGPLGRHGPT